MFTFKYKWNQFTWVYFWYLRTLNVTQCGWIFTGGVLLLRREFMSVYQFSPSFHFRATPHGTVNNLLIDFLFVLCSRVSGEPHPEGSTRHAAVKLTSNVCWFQEAVWAAVGTFAVVQLCLLHFKPRFMTLLWYFKLQPCLNENVALENNRCLEKQHRVHVSRPVASRVTYSTCCTCTRPPTSMQSSRCVPRWLTVTYHSDRLGSQWV